ncbi:gamma-glutamylcyclotransferase [uncultured Photobacterium sp.]|uniref:gamma-glutamylcyclotransferase family protein n=1 Tax=uncultured Photobacterium sp. TaxID=173973 RepID=UPI00260A3BCB|nr:gamma-glutamylcyclotransferase family protein [uncultured Photobacterium sp.]
MTRVFVYGTLRAGESNHHFLRQASLLGPARLTCGFWLYDLGLYPAAVKCRDESRPLVGEVYEIDDDMFAALDELEEYPQEYTRELVETDYGQAWIYLYRLSVSQLPEIRSGDWCQK